MKRILSTLLATGATASLGGPVGPLRRIALLKQSRPHALSNVGFALLLSTTTLNDQLALRSSLLAATVFFLSNNLAGALSTTSSVNWPGASCQVVLLAGHWFRTSHLAKKRLAVRRRHLTAQERQLYDLVFKQYEVDLSAYKSLLGAGIRWGSCPAGTVLATEGKRHSRVVLLMEGSVDVSRNGKVVEQIGPGSTAAVGGLLGGEFVVRQTTARAATPLTYAYWECAPLKQHFRDDPAARYAMTTLLANDEARRLRVLRHEYQTRPPLGDEA